MDAEKELATKFYKIFFVSLFFFTIVFIVFIISSIIVWEKYLQNTVKLSAAIIPSVVALSFLICILIGSMPYLLDFFTLRKKQFIKIKGIVVRYKKIVHGGEPETESYYPIVRDTYSNELMLKVKGTELNDHYSFLYLKHTKLAVIESKRTKN